MDLGCSTYSATRGSSAYRRCKLRHKFAGMHHQRRQGLSVTSERRPASGQRRFKVALTRGDHPERDVGLRNPHWLRDGAVRRR